MKIGIYARGLSNKLGGVKEVIKLMCETLVHQIGPEDELFIFHNLKSAFFDTPKPRVTEIMLHCGSVFFCDYVLAPRAINQRNLDVVWFPKNVIPFFIKPKTVVTVHDLAYFLPEYRAYPFMDTLYMKIMIRRSCKRADRIVTVSHNTKSDVEKILHTSPRKIKVVHLGLDKKYRVIKDRASLQAVKEKYNLPDRFILNTGSITPRKNLLRLLLAFNAISATDPDIYLVLTGFISYKSERENKIIHQNPRIIKTGFVEDLDMPYLYNLAALYIYPSLYEGFGFPVLEAQACGCPVIAAHTSSIPEVGRDSVYYIRDPHRVEEIEAAMRHVLYDEGLRHQLIQKGHRNCAGFSWEKAGRDMLGILRGVSTKTIN